MMYNLKSIRRRDQSLSFRVSLMALNKTLRRKEFTKNLLEHLNALPKSSYKNRKQRRVDLKTIAADLARTNGLPSFFKNLKPEAIYRLVNHWKRNQLSRKTMQNRLGLLRKLNTTLKTPIAIPSNKELDIQGTTPSKIIVAKDHIDPYQPLDFSPATMIQNIFLLQYLFGLKAHEALMLESSMVHPEHLTVARNISYNKKDRLIRYETQEQKDFIIRYTQNHNFKLMQDADFRKGLTSLHAFAMSQLKIKHPDYFRHQYIKNRFVELRKTKGEAEVLKVLQQELGYSKSLEIRAVLDRFDLRLKI